MHRYNVTLTQVGGLAMSSEKRGKEPKVHFLFRLIASKSAREKLESRRFEGLKDREGVLPSGIPTDESVIEYYTEKDRRNTSSVRILDMEAKSAFDDSLMKIFGTLTFFAFAAGSLAAGWFDEVRADMFPNRAGLPYSGPAVALFVISVLVANGVLFFLMYNLFSNMDHKWSNTVDGFFARNARVQMDAVRNCMVVFKRFLKWRRYMRLMMVAAGAALLLQAAMAVVTLPPQLSASWSEDEARLFWLFMAGQLIWFTAYFYMWAYYTTYRDPTLQLCTLVNVMDRATVQAPTIDKRS
jgi:hypothetical protein